MTDKCHHELSCTLAQYHRTRRIRKLRQERDSFRNTDWVEAKKGRGRPGSRRPLMLLLRVADETLYI